MCYVNTNSETVRLICHYDIFSQLLRLSKAISTIVVRTGSAYGYFLLAYMYLISAGRVAQSV
jgi:hypothetical protein